MGKEAKPKRLRPYCYFQRENDKVTMHFYFSISIPAKLDVKLTVPSTKPVDKIRKFIFTIVEDTTQTAEREVYYYETFVIDADELQFQTITEASSSVIKKFPDAKTSPGGTDPHYDDADGFPAGN